jgi:hypothetical protein
MATRGLNVANGIDNFVPKGMFELAEMCGDDECTGSWPYVFLLYPPDPKSFK